MTSAEERKGENESFFRELNERLERNAAGKHNGERTFQAVCECASEACTRRLSVSFAEYEWIRDDAARFIVARGHVDTQIERIVKSASGYAVVEKLGEVAEVARGHDPRRNL
jgi:hypothetical protein